MNEKLRTLIENELGIDASEITSDLAYASIPEWDSPAHLTLVYAIEDEFGIEFETDEIVKMTTVGEIEKIIASKQAA